MKKARVGLMAAAMTIALGACGGGSSLGKAVSANTTASSASTKAPASSDTPSTASSSKSGDICSVAKDLSTSDLTSGLSGSGNMKDTFTKLNSALDKLQSSAPAEIKGDIDTLTSAIKKLDALYAKAGYDSSKVVAAAASDPAAAADAEKAVADPSFSAAAEHITSYFQSHCS